jgi:hypothetical protein
MGYLDQFLAQVDNIRRVAGRNVSDLASDPSGYVDKIVGNLRNSNENVVPTIAGGQLTNRPMTQDEITEKYVGAADPGGLGKLTGGLGIIKTKGGNWVNKELRNAADDLYYRQGSSAHRLRPTADEMEALGAGRHGWYIPKDQGMNEFMAEKMPDDPRVLAEQWQRGPLMNYVKNLAGTAEDPLLALGEQGISHLDLSRKVPRQEVSLSALRTEAGFPARGISKGKLAKEWEKRADTMIMGGDAKDTLRAAQEYADKNMFRASDADAGAMNTARAMVFEDSNFGGNRVLPTGEELANRYGWIDKTAPGTRIHSFNRDSTNPTAEFGQLGTLTNVTLDALRSGELTPAQIRSGAHTVENAVRMADKLRKAKEAAVNAPDVHFTMPKEGLSVVRLNRPGQFAAESDAMGHSVRGYEPDGSEEYGLGGWKAIEKGQAQVYSVRDDKGKPLATIEAQNTPGQGLFVTQIKGRFNRKVDPRAIPAIKSFFDQGNFNVPKSNLDQSGLHYVGPPHNGTLMDREEMKRILDRRDENGNPVMDDLMFDTMKTWQQEVIER